MKFSKIMICAIALTGMLHTAIGMANDEMLLLVKNETDKEIKAYEEEVRGKMRFTTIKPGETKPVTVTIGLDTSFYTKEHERIEIEHPVKGLIQSYEPTDTEPWPSLTLKEVEGKIIGELELK